MSLRENEIDWSVMTSEDAKKVRWCVDKGAVESISSCFNWQGLPNQVMVEKELQKIVNQLRPYVGFESQVRKELDIALSKNPTLLNDPQVELEWQQKQTKEFQDYRQKVDTHNGVAPVVVATTATNSVPVQVDEEAARTNSTPETIIGKGSEPKPKRKYTKRVKVASPLTE